MKINLVINLLLLMLLLYEICILNNKKMVFKLYLVLFFTCNAVSLCSKSIIGVPKTIVYLKIPELNTESLRLTQICVSAE